MPARHAIEPPPEHPWASVLTLGQRDFHPPPLPALLGQPREAVAVSILSDHHPHDQPPSAGQKRSDPEYWARGRFVRKGLISMPNFPRLGVETRD